MSLGLNDVDEYLAEVEMTVCQLEERIEILGLEFSPETYFEMDSETIEQKIRDATSTQSVVASTLPITRPTTVSTTRPTTTETTTTTEEPTTTTETITTTEETTTESVTVTDTTTSTVSTTSTMSTTSTTIRTLEASSMSLSPTTRPRLLQPPGIDMLNTLLTNMLDSVTTVELPTQIPTTIPDIFTYSMLPTTASLTVSSLMSSTVSTSVSPTIVSTNLSPTETAMATQSVELTSSTNVVHVLEGEQITTTETVTFGTSDVANLTMPAAPLYDETTFNIVTSSAVDENILVLEMTTDSPGKNIIL